MKELNKKEICKWLENQIKIKNAFNSIRNFSDEIMACNNYSDSGIHIFRGIDDITETIEEPLMRIEFDPEHDLSEHTRYEYYFYYKGERFFQLVDEDELEGGKIIK